LLKYRSQSCWWAKRIVGINGLSLAVGPASAT
jgi:hypothetical protein